MIPTDGMEYAGWAMKEPGSESIKLTDVCDTEREAIELRRQAKIRQPHRGWLDVVPVRITVTEVT